MATLYDITKPVPVMVESIEARDRRDCVELDKKAIGANKELAQWLLDHPTYSGTAVAGWLGCGEHRIRRLRVWAKDGFPLEGPQAHAKRATALDAPLKTHDNFQDDDWEPSEEASDGVGGVESPDQILWHLLDTIKGQQAAAEAYRKIFKKASFDREEKAKIYNAITQLIAKWKHVQSTLDRKGQGNGSD